MSVYNNQAMLANEELLADTQTAARPRLYRRWLVPVSLGVIILLGTALRFYQLGAAGYGNQYYAATVKSMLTSPHNFFYAAFEPAGSVSVDKPPLGFWLQAISAAILGVNGFALALPQALAGVLSLPLLFHLVRRHFGAYAGLLAAFVLAITPVTVSTERNNTIDGTLVFALLLAAWFFLMATETGRKRWLFLGAFMVGVAFNIKMLQAYLPLPAFLALYFLGAPGRWWRKGLHLVGAGLIILVVSLAWPLAVDLTPPENRPYVGSSQNNTVMELIIGHNGLARLLPGGRQAAAIAGVDDNAAPTGPGQPDGQTLPGDQGPAAPPPNQPPPAGSGQPGAPSQSLPPGPGGLNQGQLPPPGQPGAPDQSIPVGPGQPGFGPPPNDGGRPPNDGGQPGQPGAGPAGGNPINQEVGEPGLARLFSEPLATEASWLFPLAFLGLVAALLAARPRWPLAPAHQALVLWGGWFGVQLVFFSFANLFHAYYMIMFGPPLAALVAMAGWGLARLFRRQPAGGWGAWLVAALLTLACQLYWLRGYADVNLWLAPAAVFLAGLGLLGGLAALAWRQRWLERASLGGLLLALCLAPLTWSTLTTLNSGADANLPRSGPTSSDRPLRGRGEGLNDVQAAILDYVNPLTTGQNYLLAAPDAKLAAPFILATDRAVLTFGGFSGGDDVIGAAELAALVESGALRFVLDDGSLRGRKVEVYQWLVDHCATVDLPGLNQAPAGPGIGPDGPGGLGGGTLTLYDCAP